MRLTRFSEPQKVDNHTHHDNIQQPQTQIQLQTQTQIPITPQTQTIAVFPPLTSTRSRRCSRENSAICSSSSSLYDTNLNFEDKHQEEHNAFTFAYSSDDHNYENSDDEETDTDIDLEFASRSNSIGRSQELFRKNIWDSDLSSGTKSPTYNNSTSIMKNDYFSSPINENTPIFKRLVSKNSLKPQLKSFRRITAELQHESVPFENEINHEKLILLNLKDEDNLGPLLGKLEDNDSKKIDIIRKANENWNLKKHANILGKSKSVSLKPSGKEILQTELDDGVELNRSSSGSINDEQITPHPMRKRSYDNDNDVTTTPTARSRSTFSSKFKRRAVSTSPISAGIFKRGNIKLISNASKDLEKMSLE